MTYLPKSIFLSNMYCRDLHAADKVQVLEVLYADERPLRSVNIECFYCGVSQCLPVAGRNPETCYRLGLTATQTTAVLRQEAKLSLG